jgi:hypothetical protein
MLCVCDWMALLLSRSSPNHTPIKFRWLVMKSNCITPAYLKSGFTLGSMIIKFSKCSNLIRCGGLTLGFHLSLVWTNEVAVMQHHFSTESWQSSPMEMLPLVWETSDRLIQAWVESWVWKHGYVKGCFGPWQVSWTWTRTLMYSHPRLTY